MANAHGSKAPTWCSLCRPTSASIMASTLPSFSRFKRVSTWPLTAMGMMSGRLLSMNDWRRPETVPTIPESGITLNASSILDSTLESSNSAKEE